MDKSRLYASSTIISHFITPDWVKREIICEFDAILCIHSGENIAAITFRMLEDFNVLCRLLAIIADNAPNNNTLVEHLYGQHLKQFEDDMDPDFAMSLPIMQFHAKQRHN